MHQCTKLNTEALEISQITVMQWFSDASVNHFILLSHTCITTMIALYTIRNWCPLIIRENSFRRHSFFFFLPSCCLKRILFNLSSQSKAPLTCLLCTCIYMYIYTSASKYIFHPKFCLCFSCCICIYFNYKLSWYFRVAAMTRHWLPLQISKVWPARQSMQAGSSPGSWLLQFLQNRVVTGTQVHTYSECYLHYKPVTPIHDNWYFLFS